jgi:hypothetical protein
MPSLRHESNLDQHCRDNHTALIITVTKEYARAIRDWRLHVDERSSPYVINSGFGSSSQVIRSGYGSSRLTATL